MTRDEIAQLLTAAKSLDAFIKGDKNQINAWYATFDANMPFDFARKILVQHYRVSEQTIKPVIFIRAWQAERNLMNRDKDEENPINHVPATRETVSKFAAIARSAMAQSKIQHQFAHSSGSKDSREDQ